MTEDKKFGLALTSALALVGGLSCWRGHAILSLVFGIVAAVTLAVLFLAPRLMKYPRAGLMAVGWFNGQLILALVFYLVFTPMGVLMRVFGKDPLAKNWDKSLDSYWILKEKTVFDPKNVERQF
ncbi:MAG: SxtJ family membrane protein [bacterium]|nr:SxtJ family membrane protein [bacterium]